MRRFLQTIDDLLRGRLTRKEDLAAGKVQIPIGTLILAGLALGALYGVFMGLFALLRAENASFGQLVATMVKVPLLFLMTLVITYPSLYVVSAMFDSKLRHTETLRLLLAAMAANLALLASLGPVTGFFTLSTDSYPFMVVLNVAFFAVAGFVGLGFLRKALRAVFETETYTTPPESSDPENPQHVPLRIRRTQAASMRVFSFWILIYGVVGAQMGWVLRPFIGTPTLPFEWFRAERESNFFEALLQALGKLLS